MVIPDSSWTVYATSINTVLQAAERLGADRSALLAAAGIDKDWLRQSEQCVPVAHLFKLYQAAEQAVGSADIALYSGRVAYITGLHVQLYMQTICQSFRDYLNLMPSVLKLRGDIGVVEVSREGDLIRLEWLPLLQQSAQQRYLTDEILSASALIVNSLCVQPIPVIRAHFSYPEPKDILLLRTVFGNDLRFDQPVSSIYLERASLNHAIAHVDYALKDEFTDSIRRLVHTEDNSDIFLTSLRQSILRLLPAGEMTIDTVAGELNVSRRTLQRRLSERDTQFLQILQEVRAGLAERYLADKRLGITEIAFLLGYADQGSFSTAFKSWHGISPSEHRQR